MDALDRPILLYRDTCAKCRLSSRAVMLLAGGRLRRVPVDSAEALSLYARFGVPPGRLAVVYRGRLRSSWSIPLAIAEAFADGARGRWRCART
jgi:hypothetical protein